MEDSEAKGVEEVGKVEKEIEGAGEELGGVLAVDEAVVEICDAFCKKKEEKA